jgi:pyruvate dehydrogenase E1 component beta subunit
MHVNGNSDGNGGRILTFAKAIYEATEVCLEKDSRVLVMGLGVPDSKGVFGTTLNLAAKYGSERVFDMPTSENGMTGVAIGCCLVGLRPVMVHQRVDFAILAMDQIVNQAAKWYYMYGGQKSVPIVIRLIIGRGWGQGPQHSQSLQSWFAHVPGLKVVMPSSPFDAKGLLISSIEDNNPVIFLEHRWLHNVNGYVPEGAYRVPLGTSQIARKGADVTIASTSFMTLEAMRAATILESDGIQAEVVDIRTLRPFDEETILGSVRKTGRLVVVDNGWEFCGFGAEVVAKVCEKGFSYLTAAPARLAIIDGPIPSSPALAAHYYPRAHDIARRARLALGLDSHGELLEQSPAVPNDVPDPTFAGPF